MMRIPAKLKEMLEIRFLEKGMIPLSVDIMVATGGIKPPRVTLTRIEYSGKQEETLKH
jgi:hypothetical protein